MLSILSLSILATPPALARGYPRRGKATPAPIVGYTNDRITALHLTSVTVTIATTHQSKEFKVNPATKITLNGQAAALNGLAVGMDVTVTPAPNDPTTAAAIDAKTRR